MRILRATLGLLILAGIALIAAPVHLDAQTVKHNCSFCHNLHGGSYQALNDYAITEDLCDSCHGIAGPDSVYRDLTLVEVPKAGRGADPNSYFVVHNGAKHTAQTGCWDCHNHEGEAGSNLRMIQAQMPTPNSGILPVVLTNVGWTGSGSMGDDDAPVGGYYDGVCQACHTVTDVHRNDAIQPDPPNKTHGVGVDCTTCHKHDTGFAGTGGGCAGCHGSQQSGTNVRRAVVGEFDRAVHHVDWSGAGLSSSADIPDEDCLVCHDQAGDHPSDSNTDLVFKNSDNPGTTYTVTGDPSTTAAQASILTPFCLSCHDTDGAAGDTTPFSDDTAVPAPIDATAFTASSHSSSGGLSCYGNGTFGCHASGHGSEKANMLTPPDVAATSTWLTEDEEGFCLNCHDSDGPASSDLKTGMNTGINWVQTATGLNANPNLNDRHDVQTDAQVRSGARIECTSCHNPHEATAAQPYVLDPDPSDGHVPGTDYYYYSASSDVLSEFCLDCHDGSWAAGVQDSLPGITNIQTTWANDGMGGRTGSSVDLRSGTGWAVGDVMPCWACHSPHPVRDADADTTSLFMVADTVLNKAGDTYLFYKDRKASDPEIYNYSITDNVDKNDLTSGGYWCNTCHNRYSMTGKENCYSCHRHGDGGRF